MYSHVENKINLNYGWKSLKKHKLDHSSTVTDNNLTLIKCQGDFAPEVWPAITMQLPQESCEQ